MGRVGALRLSCILHPHHPFTIASNDMGPQRPRATTWMGLDPTIRYPTAPGHDLDGSWHPTIWYPTAPGHDLDGSWHPTIWDRIIANDGDVGGRLTQPTGARPPPPTHAPPCRYGPPTAPGHDLDGFGTRRKGTPNGPRPRSGWVRPPTIWDRIMGNGGNGWDPCRLRFASSRSFIHSISTLSSSQSSTFTAPSNSLTSFTVSTLTVTTRLTRRTIYSSSSWLGSLTIPLRLSVVTWY
jgi:hypothetical protein